MYRLLLAAMLFGAIAEFDLKPSDLADCSSKKCIYKIEMASWKVLKVDWKPISVFPVEAKKFR